MGIPLYCLFGEEVLWKFLNSVFPSKSSSSRLNWKASPLQLYVPSALVAMEGFYTSHAVVYPYQHAVCVNAKPPKCLPYGILGSCMLHAESYACTSD